MRQYKLYMEDELGNRVVVEAFYPGHLGQEVNGCYQYDSDNMMKKLLVARDKLSNLKQDAVPSKMDLMSQYDILTKLLHYSETEATEIVTRKKIENLENIRMQIMAQNPQLLGLGKMEE